MSRLQIFLGKVALFLFVLTFAITITINFTPLYHYDIHSLRLTTIAGFNQDILMKNYHQLLNYLNLPWKQTLVLSDFPFSDSAAKHFYEVKQLFTLNYLVLFLSAIASFWYLQRLRKQHQMGSLLRFFQWSMIGLVIVLICMALNFTNFFTVFHEILFRNQDWLFDPTTDPIILVLPEEFFMHCFILAFILIESFFGIGWLASRISLKKEVQLRKITKKS